MSDYDWAAVRARYEGGETAYHIAKDQRMPSKRTIHGRAKKEGWKHPDEERLKKYSRSNRPAQKHGLNTMKRALNALGSRAVDKRTALGRALSTYRLELLNALGGEDSVSPQRKTIIDRAVIPTAVMLSSVDAYLLELGEAVINKRHKKLYPIVKQRQEMADALVNYLNRLGLDRQKAQALSFDEYAEMVRREGARENSANGAAN